MTDTSPVSAPIALASDVAMVYAAGIGKRMRPLTATRPKPLVRVAGRPLIDHALDKLAEAGVARAVVNVHYLADQLEAHVARRRLPVVSVSDERDELLDTGGGLVKALPLLGRETFFTVNSDAIWLDGPRDAFATLSQQWDPARMDALMLVVTHARAFNHEGSGDFHMDPVGVLRWRQPGRIAPYVWTGIQLVHERLLHDAPSGPFGVKWAWNRAMAAGRLYGAAFAGTWHEVGAPHMIAPTEAALAVF